MDSRGVAWGQNQNMDFEMQAPQHEQGSNDEGENAMSVDDSSEEEDSDPEEAARIKEGFIVDEDEEEEDDEDQDDQDQEDKTRTEKRRHKKHRRKHRAPEEEEEELGDLDEDDLDLVEENTGTRIARPSKSRLKRLRRGREDGSLDGDNDLRTGGARERGTHEMNDMWADEGPVTVQRRDEEEEEEGDFDDDMGGFIEADDDDEENAMGEAERQERLERRRAEKERRKIAGFPKLAGLDQNALAMLHEVFGDGTDYDWALGDDIDEQEELRKETKYTDVFEPSEIRARMLTDDDDLIRAQDIPERMQLVTSSLSTETTLSLDPPISALDLHEAAYWVSLRLGKEVKDRYFREGGLHRSHLQDLIAAVQTSLELLFIQHLEVPFIATHKTDCLWVINPTEQIELLSSSLLWRVYTLGQKFRGFLEKKKALEATHSRLSSPDDYYKSDIQPKLDSLEAIADATEWLTSKHRVEMQDASHLEADDSKIKRPTRISNLDMLKNSPIAQLVAEFCPSSQEISRKVREVMNAKGNVVHRFLEDPSLPPHEHVIPFVEVERERLMDIEKRRWALFPNAQNETSHSQEIDSEKILERARLLISMDLSKDPLLRQHVRELYKEAGQVTCLPTDKGLSKIDENHPYYSFKYLKQKPVSVINEEKAPFLQILAAEADNLVTFNISIKEEARLRFVNALTQAVSSDGYSAASQLWNEVRAQAVTEAVDNYLLPLGAKWTREWLREEEEDASAERCGQVLYDRINVAPWFTELSDRGLEAPTVMAISSGEGDPKKDAISVVCLDQAGRLREHAKFDNLMEQELVAEFLSIMKRRSPDIIVIGGFSANTGRLSERVRYLARDPEYEEEQKKLPEDQRKILEKGSFEDMGQNPTLVKYIPDSVARIFQHNKRAEDEFGTLPVITRYCIGLARYTQNPLNEYAALGQDITVISFDQDSQNLIPRAKLLMALERSLVDVVNSVGVDINRAVHDPYYQTLLPFVSGLGPRKAQHIVKKIQAMGALINREQFVRDGIMTTKVWLNAAAFLKIPQDPDWKPPKASKQNSEHLDFSEMPDPLDGTRLHPQDYELARKMAIDAMEVDEEDYAEEHPSAVVTMFLKEDEWTRKKQLEVLSLDEFAQNLLQTQNERKRKTLDLINQELRHPFEDHRRAPSTMSPNDVLTMLTGETQASVETGVLVSVQVSRIKQHFVMVKMASGLEAVLNTVYLVDDGEPPVNPDRVLKPGQVIRGVIIGSKPSPLEVYAVEISARPSDVVRGVERTRKVRPDVYFDHERAARDAELLQRKKNSQQNKARRMVKHPNFFNMKSKEAEAYLSKRHRGDVVIRPSSNGPEHLAVTWKVEKGIYQHLDVLEVPVDANDPMAGYKYIVDYGRESQREYSDLDELIVNHIKAMARKVEELMAHDKYKHETPEQLAENLTLLLSATPDKSLYAFCLNPDRPGYFNLMFKANQTAPVVAWPVKVTPEAYVFFGDKLPSVPQLCDAFKMRHLGSSLGAAKPLFPGMTPHGSRTPGRMTPAVHRVGKTPNPYQAQPPMATGAPIAGYGMPPPQTPSWGQPPSQPHMNPARAALIQQTSGWSTPSVNQPWQR